MCNSSCWVPDAGRTEYWEVFQDAYRAVMQHYRSGAWYDDADIVTGRTLHQQFQSLQAFWPGACLLAPSCTTFFILVAKHQVTDAV